MVIPLREGIAAAVDDFAADEDVTATVDAVPAGCVAPERAETTP